MFARNSKRIKTALHQFRSLTASGAGLCGAAVALRGGRGSASRLESRSSVRAMASGGGPDCAGRDALGSTARPQTFSGSTGMPPAPSRRSARAAAALLGDRQPPLHVYSRALRFSLADLSKGGEWRASQGPRTCRECPPWKRHTCPPSLVTAVGHGPALHELDSVEPAAKCRPPAQVCRQLPARPRTRAFVPDAISVAGMVLLGERHGNDLLQRAWVALPWICVWRSRHSGPPHPPTQKTLQPTTPRPLSIPCTTLDLEVDDASTSQSGRDRR